MTNGSAHLEQLIADWRASAIDPSQADADELELRRILAASSADVDAIAADQRHVSNRDFLRAIAALGHETGLAEQLLRRQLAKENTSLRHLVTGIEDRLRKLEKKAYPAGGNL